MTSFFTYKDFSFIFKLENFTRVLEKSKPKIMEKIYHEIDLSRNSFTLENISLHINNIILTLDRIFKLTSGEAKFSECL